MSNPIFANAAEATRSDWLGSTHSLGGLLGRTRPEERTEVFHDLTIAKTAYHLAKLIEKGDVVFTEADADVLCAVIRARLGGGE